MNAGIHDLTAKAYHNDPCDPPSLSASIAHLLCTRSARHAWAAHPRLNPDFVREERDDFDIGTVAHAMMLQGADILEPLDFKDWRTDAAKDAKAEARAAGKIPLLTKHVDRVTAMVDAAMDQILAHKADPPLFADGKAEQTLVWEDNHGVMCRARVDWLHADLVTMDDYKTTSASAEPALWTRRTMVGIGGDIQAAFYLRGLNIIQGRAGETCYPPHFRFVVQETYPPYELSVCSLGPDVLTVAERKVQWAIDQWARCLDSGVWPGYPTKVCYAELQGWEDDAWIDREEKAKEAA